MKYKVAFVVLIAVIVATGVYIVSPKSANRPKPASEAPSVPQQVSIRGTRVCLPHKDASGPQTMECAYGIKRTDGTYYALDMSAMLENGMDMGSQTEIEVAGNLVPIEQISSEAWQKYDIKGIIKVEKMTGV